MKGLRADLIILSVILSVAAHFGIMYYARQRVMTSVALGVPRVVKRGPMKVTEAQDIPEPVEISTFVDIKPEKDAPVADDVIALTPKLESDLPVDDGALSVPEIAMPEISTAEIPVEKLPELVASAASPETAPEIKMITEAIAPSATDGLMNMPSASSVEIPLDPGFGLPDFGGGGLPPMETEEALLSKIVKADQPVTAPKPEFIPPPEVMAKVDESVVIAEKEAVRELVDAVNAEDLSKAVDVKLAHVRKPDGTYFRVAVTPREDLKPVPKDLVVLIDASGSIGKERMRSIRQAAKTILRSAANTGDRFNLVAFRDRYSYAFNSWQEYNVETFTQADNWLNNVAPFGRTDVFATIRSVLTLPREPSRPLIALVVTDGDANTGVRNTADIISQFSKLNDGLVSVYMYGVASSANRELIDVLTRGNRGDSFIFTGERWRAGSGIEPMSRHFRDPVLTDIRLVFASDCEATTYPRLLKNLYRGEKVEFIGRVPKGTNEIAFSLKGLNGKDAYEAFFRLPIDLHNSAEDLERAWLNGRAVDLKLR